MTSPQEMKVTKAVSMVLMSLDEKYRQDKTGHSRQSEDGGVLHQAKEPGSHPINH